MDRRPPGMDPAKVDDDKASPETEAAVAPGTLSEAEWDRILPPIDEDDPEWQDHVRRKIREALDDPRPDIPAEEAFAEVYAHIESRRAARRRGD